MQGHNGHKGPEYLNLFSIGPFRPLCPYPLFPDAEAVENHIEHLPADHLPGDLADIVEG